MGKFPEIVKARVTPEAREAIAKMADDSGASATDIVRTALDQYLAKGVAPLTDRQRADVESRFVPAVEDQLQKAAGQLRAVLDAVEAIAARLDRIEAAR
jgi:hypothetical protein